MTTDFLETYFTQLFALAAVWSICGCAITYFIMKRKGTILPSRKTANVLFEEKGVSGRSHKSVISKMGGGRNCIVVTITDQELWIDAIFPFNIIAFYYDGVHRLSLSKIKKVTQPGRSVLVEFERNDGSDGTFELYLKNPSGFMKILNNIN